jgi:Ubiquitin carboxyl-terminal hydrolase
MHSGHYYSYVCDGSGRRNWWCMNDSQVRQVQLQEVMSDSAYLLFYVRNRMKRARRLPDAATAQSQPAAAVDHKENSSSQLSQQFAKENGGEGHEREVRD